MAASPTTIKSHASEIERLANAVADGVPGAREALVTATDKLLGASQTPNERLYRHRLQPLQNMCARLAVEMGLVDAIAARGGAAVTAAELAKETGAEELLVVRIMRPLTHPAVGMFDEVDEHTYAANEVTKLFNTPGMIGGEKHQTDLLFPVFSNIIKYYREHGTINMFPDEPGEKSVFQYTFGASLFELLETDQEQKEAFDGLMKGRREGTTIRWYDTYPAAEKLGPKFTGDPEKDAFIVDVGGNQGHDLLAFRKAHPELPGRFVLQDLGYTLDNLESPERFEGTNVETMKYDFFTPQPVKGALAYFFRNIAHDWSDRRCREFLGQTVKSMTKGYSRILIDDWVLPESAVPWRAAHVDVLMMLYTTGMERTSKQWESLLDSVGLKIVDIWGSDKQECVIEAMLKD